MRRRCDVSLNSVRLLLTVASYFNKHVQLLRSRLPSGTAGKQEDLFLLVHFFVMSTFDYSA